MNHESRARNLDASEIRHESTAAIVVRLANPGSRVTRGEMLDERIAWTQVIHLVQYAFGSKRFRNVAYARNPFLEYARREARGGIDDLRSLWPTTIDDRHSRLRRTGVRRGQRAHHEVGICDVAGRQVDLQREVVHAVASTEALERVCERTPRASL